MKIKHNKQMKNLIITSALILLLTGCKTSKTAERVFWEDKEIHFYVDTYTSPNLIQTPKYL